MNEGMNKLKKTKKSQTSSFTNFLAILLAQVARALAQPGPGEAAVGPLLQALARLPVPK